MEPSRDRVVFVLHPNVGHIPVYTYEEKYNRQIVYPIARVYVCILVRISHKAQDRTFLVCFMSADVIGSV